MSHRIQITLEDNLWEFLQNIPKNARSQIIKQAVTDESVSYTHLDVYKRQAL